MRCPVSQDDQVYDARCGGHSGRGASTVTHRRTARRRPMKMLFDCRRRTALILLPLAAGAALPLVPPSWAQGYPSRPVQLVVAYPPGGTGDLIARPLADALSSALGQPVEVVNRAGSSGSEGARSVA